MKGREPVSTLLAFLPLISIITPMRGVQRQLDRILTLLGNVIRRQGYTQLEVQEALGWGRSYISQLTTKQKGLRVEQVLLILNVIGVDPAEFYGELYWPEVVRRVEQRQQPPGPEVAEAEAEVREDVEHFRRHLRGFVDLLLDKGIVDTEELTAAAKGERD